MAKFDFSNTFVSVTPGCADVYKVEIVTTEKTKTQKGTDRRRFQARVVEGAKTGTEQADCTIRDGFNLARTPKQIKDDIKHDRDDQDKRDMDQMMNRMWMSFFLSVGFDQAEIREKGFDFDKVNDAGAFENLIGRTGYVKFKPADPENGQRWPKTNWLTANQWNAMCSAVEEIAAATTDDDDIFSRVLNG
tara:strand:+ start:11565 stop:12134 length:570 start_codon:yes stop_codon:yes gene_type:complete